DRVALRGPGAPPTDFGSLTSPYASARWSNLPLSCPVCGQKIPPSVGECLYCPPPDTGKGPAPAAGRGAGPDAFSTTPAAAVEPTAAQLLLVAEECLARGQPDKAAELGAQAIGLRPESLEAKALVNRARRQLARQ